MCSCYHPSNTNNKFFAQFIYKKDLSFENYECVEFNIKKSYLLKEDDTVIIQDRYPKDLDNKLLNFFIGKIDLKNRVEIANLYINAPTEGEGFFQKFKTDVGDADNIFSGILEKYLH